MWITKRKFEKFVNKFMSGFSQNAGTLLEKCFTVDNQGRIDVSNSNFNIYIASKVSNGVNEKELKELKDLVSGLYGVLAERTADELRRFGFIEASQQQQEEEIEMLRVQLLDSVHSLTEFQATFLNDVKKQVTDVFAEEDRQKMLHFRKNLYEIMSELWAGKRDPGYNDEICKWAGKIKEYGDDRIADFCTVFFAQTFNSNRVKDLLSGAIPDKQDDVLFFLRTVLLNYDSKYDMKPWIKACQDRSLRRFFECRYAEEQKKFEDGTYDPTRSRDVFIAYNHEDRDKALALIRELEGKNFGFECFFSERNLKQSRTWDTDLESAMNNCRVFVFVSTPHSRSAGSYTHTEMSYIKKCDLRRAGKTDNDPYEEVERKDRTPRVEYLPDGKHYETKSGYAKDVGAFFAGLSYYDDIAKVCDAVYDIIKNGAWAKESKPRPASLPPKSDREMTVVTEAPAVPARKNVKYCLDCLEECDKGAEKCPHCGFDMFEEDKSVAERQAMAQYCDRCGKENLPNAKYCEKCGGTEFWSGIAAYEKAKREQRAEKRKDRRDRLSTFVSKHLVAINRILLIVAAMNFLFQTIFPQVFFIPFLCLTVLLAGAAVVVWKYSDGFYNYGDEREERSIAVYLLLCSVLFGVMGVMVRLEILYSYPDSIGLGGIALGFVGFFLLSFMEDEGIVLLGAFPLFVLLPFIIVGFDPGSVTWHLISSVSVVGIVTMVYSFFSRKRMIWWVIYGLASIGLLIGSTIALMGIAS